jgi:hypothetical protein
MRSVLLALAPWLALLAVLTLMLQPTFGLREAWVLGSGLVLIFASAWGLARARTRWRRLSHLSALLIAVALLSQADQVRLNLPVAVWAPLAVGLPPLAAVVLFASSRAWDSSAPETH